MEDATTVTTTRPVVEHRESYGTAKTENLRDTGWWRIVLPLVVVGGCAALIAIPLIFLVPLLVNSFSATAASNMQHQPLSWLWIVMIVLIMIVDAVVVRGLLKVFFTQAGNYN